jgi:alpha-glucosidase
MKKLLAVIIFCLHCCLTGTAIDLNGLEAIGAAQQMSKDANSVTVICADGSRVRLFVLAPDVVRVRVAFRKDFPAVDHSWAVAKTDWNAVRWDAKETPDAYVVTTDELEAVVQKSPLLISFRDKRTGRVVNADERPPMFDGRGVKRAQLFDPESGPMIASAKRLAHDEYFYGLGEKAARLEKRRGHFTNWNSDTPGYALGRDPIYQTVPFYIGLQRGEAYGLFYDNSYKSYFDFGNTQQEWAGFAAEGGELNYYFFWGPSIKKILGRYTELTGRMPMPPKWALGHQASRWSYYPEKLVEDIAAEYRKRDIPLDVMTLDIHYMQGYRVFTWDKSRFPDPKAMTERLGKQGIKVVAIVDPGVKNQPASAGALEPGEDDARRELRSTRLDYYVYNEGAARGYFLKRRNGQIYVGQVWPGESVLADYTREDARRWWGDLHRAYTDFGVAGIWTDMNEPSDFVDQTGGNQRDVVSYDAGQNTPHAKNRNTFALLMAKATYEGLQRLQPDRRPFVISRAGYAGLQRYSSMWNGDTVSSWDNLALSLPMFQTLGLSGQTFVGGDVGGFIGRADGELMARSYQVFSLVPFCRNHHELSGYDHEPWRFGQGAEDNIRKYLKLRYRLMPFLYTTMEEAHRTGVPLFRPLLLNYQTDESAFNLDNQFMVGADLLAAPVLKPDQTSRLVYLPAGVWHDFWTGKKYAGGKTYRVDAPLETMPLFVRGGAILPSGPDMNWTSEKAVDPITFSIYPDADGQAAATLYEDDGASPNYQRGQFRRTTVQAAQQGGVWMINLNAPQGNYQPGGRNFVFVLKGLAAAKEVALDGKALANGWRVENGEVTVRFADDGQAHQIRVR